MKEPRYVTYTVDKETLFEIINPIVLGAGYSILHTLEEIEIRAPFWRNFVKNRFPKQFCSFKLVYGDWREPQKPQVYQAQLVCGTVLEKLIRNC